MNTISDAHEPDKPGIEPSRAKSEWIVAFSIVYTNAGLIALCSVALVTAASVFVVGIAMVFAATAEVANAFQFKSR